MMKRLLLLSALLLSFAPFGHAQTKTDTLYFEFALEEGTSSATIEYGFSEAVLPGIQMEYHDGTAHPKFTPNTPGMITVTGSGHGRIYYTYEESEGYSAYLSSFLTSGRTEDIIVHTLSKSNVHLTLLDVHACAALKSLNCDNNQLTGLNVRGCLNLEKLDCHGNQLTTLDISTDTALKELECRNNQLTSLDVRQNTDLQILYCLYNQLTALDVSANTDLENLACDNNQLTALDVSANTALKELACDNNQLTALDVSANTALEELGCGGNQLTALDVSNNPDLTDLSCGNNQLTSLDVSNHTRLAELMCAENLLTALDVSGCIALANLSCENNQLTALDISGCTELEALFCGHNQLTALDISDCSALMGLMCENNRLSELIVGEESSLMMLSCGNNRLPLSTLYGFSDVMMLDADPQTDTVALAGCQTLNLGTEKTLGENETTFVLKDEAGNEVSADNYTENDFKFQFKDPFTGTLTLQNESVSDVSMTYHITAEECIPHTDTLYFEFALQEGATSATIEYGFSNAVRSGIQMEYYDGEEHAKFSPNASGNITVNGNGHGRIYYTYEESAGYEAYFSASGSGLDRDIRVRTLSGVKFTSLDVHGCADLKYLLCHNNNQMTSLNARGCLKLEELYCHSNQLTSLDVSGCTALETLQCSNNNLTALDISTNTALTSLTCSRSQLTALDVSANTALTELVCSNNQLTSLDVSVNTALTGLDCSNNPLTSLDISSNTALTVLGCSNNQLTSLDISSNTALTELGCYNNQLTSLDVSHNPALKALKCYNNQLTSLDVSADTALTTLWCDNNHLPLSTVYGIYSQRANWSVNCFYASDQTDTLALASCQALNLGTEKEFDGTATTFVLKDEAGNAVSSDDYTENDFRFQFHNPATYTLTLQNTSVRNASMTYHITVEECFTVSVSANNEAWGWATKTGNGAYAEGSSVTVIATPRAGYRFVNWTKDGEEYSTEAAHTFAVTENLTLVANFEEIPPVVVETFTLSVSANNDAWGSVSQSGNGTYEKGATATITAIPAEGYRFLNWTKDGAIFCHQADTTFAVTENLVLTANFEEIPPVVEDDFTLTLTPNNPAWGRVLKTGNCTYGEGEEITILALPFAGCRFVNWTKADGSVFSTDSLYTFKVSENLDLTANFAKIPDAPEVETFTVNISANNEAWGNVSQSGNGTYEKDASVTLTATPAEGYRFVNWTQEGAIFGTKADTTFAVTEDLTLVANFEKIPEEKPTEDDIHIYVKDNTIYLPANKGKVEIFNVIGQCMYSGHATAVRVRQTGVYIVCIAGQNHKVLVM